MATEYAKIAGQGRPKNRYFSESWLRSTSFKIKDSTSVFLAFPEFSK
jgi:hypothetical protein